MSLYAPGYPPEIKWPSQEERDNATGGYIIGCPVCPALYVANFNPKRKDTWHNVICQCGFCGNKFKVEKKPNTPEREGFYLKYIGKNKEVIRLLARRKK
jgi:transcription elongation factor Elf1